MNHLRAALIPSLFIAIVGTVLSGTSPGADAAEAASASTSSYSLGTTSVATPAAGGEYIYVATSGSDGTPRGNDPHPRVTCLNRGERDSACPAPAEGAPLKTIEGAITIARPGDVIVVRGGTYTELLGYHAQKGTSSGPIVMQAYPGETVKVIGHLNLHSPDYWTISGFDFSWGSNNTQQMVVAMYGGTNWQFIHNSIRGSHGVANLIIQPDGSPSASTAPKNYAVTSNCLASPNTKDAAGTDHNIYLQPSTYSSGGVISHNLMSGASNGGGIKASGSSSALSPHGVRISYNTVLGSASGVIIGLASTDVVVDHNVIGLPVNNGGYDGGVKTYAMENPGANSVTNNVISGYPNPIRETGDLPHGHIPVSGTIPWSPLSYTGSIANCSVALADNVRQRYGAQANPAATLTPSVSRLYGADRYGTSAGISRTYFTPGVPVAYVANGTGYADALSAGPAAAVQGGPLLLTDPNSLPTPIVTELKRLRPQKIVIVGGTQSVSRAVESTLNALVGKTAGNVARIAGSDRYDTSVKLARYAFPRGASTAYLANGANFPDALAAGPAAAHLGGPVVLVPGASSTVPAGTLAELTSLGLAQLKIAGATSAISAGIQRQVSAVSPVVRFGGADRFQTANQINADAFTGGIPAAFIATGLNFADALSASARAGVQDAPLYIAQTDCVPQGTLDQMADGDTRIAYLLGSVSTLSLGVENLFSCGS